MENIISAQFNLNKLKATIVECAKAAGSSASDLKKTDLSVWQNDYSKCWQVRFVDDLQSLQKAIYLIDVALLQKSLTAVDAALRDAVIRSNSLACTFEDITSDLMHLRQVLKTAAIASHSEY